MDIAAMWGLFSTLSGIAILFSLALYLLPIIILSFAPPQNLRDKYGDWAVVTGGSSGIGKAVVRKLAEQSVNVCIVALDDNLLTETHAELQAAFPNVELRRVAVNLGCNPDAYMSAVAAATDDACISILINNAGFLQMGFFEQRPIEQHAANVECNALAAIRLTHHFYKKMIDRGGRGCICFTSSAAWFMPSPFATMYGATKALLSHFATSLALEADAHGIDVTVFHPSYTHSNLYAKSPKLGVVAVLSKLGWTPEDVANVIFTSVGKFVDTGALTKCIMPFVASMAPPEREASIKKTE